MGSDLNASVYMQSVRSLILKGTKLTKKLAGDVYFIDLKKTLPRKHDDPIDQIHVNTAFTTTCQPHTNVHIFREEEWYRALIHESFHNLGLDFILMDSKFKKIAEDRIRAIFPVTITELRFYETYCEMWGEIMNCMFMVYFIENRKIGTV